MLIEVLVLKIYFREIAGAKALIIFRRVLKQNLSLNKRKVSNLMSKKIYF